MRLIVNPTYVCIRRSVNCFFLSCVLLSTVSILLPTIATGQEEINSEYRITLVPTYPVSKKVFLTTYLGYVTIPSDKTKTYYVGAPLLVTYRPNPVIEFMGGAFVCINNLKTGDDNTELRPIAGVKLFLPNSHNVNIYNWTRYELRYFIYKNKDLNNVRNRLRTRIGIEIPLSKKAWQPRTNYLLTDFEPFFTIEKGYFDRFRERLGLGHIINKHWRVELIYHIQLLKASKDDNPVWTDNIFRLNIKWTLSHAKHGTVHHPPDVED